MHGYPMEMTLSNQNRLSLSNMTLYLFDQIKGVFSEW